MATESFNSLPVVAGKSCEWSIGEFEHRCLVMIMREQEKPLPDNDLIAVLCNAVRLGREHIDLFARTLQEAMVSK